MELRPLGFGEIFDRAITLYIRNFVPFFGIVLVLIVPLAIAEYVADSSQSGSLDHFIHAFEHPGAKMPAPSFFSSPHEFAEILIIAALFYVLWPFALNAVAVGVARLYRGRPAEFAPCYAVVFKRWVPIGGTLLLQLGILLAWYIALSVVTFSSVLVVVVFMRAWAPLGVVSGIGAILAILAAILLLAPLSIVLSFAMYCVVLEGRGPVAAIGSGFARVFTRGEFWRAVLVALAAGAIALGAAILIAAVAWAALLLHQFAVEAVLSSLLRVAFAPFSIVLIAVYYYDVRIRREGFDLEAELERLTAGPGVT